MSLHDSYAPPRSADRTWVLAIYLANLVGCGFQILLLLGAIAAFVRERRAGAFWGGHLRFQLRSALLGGLAFIALAVVAIVAGWLGKTVAAVFGLVLFVWWVARNVMGLVRALEGQGVRDPETLGLP